MRFCGGSKGDVGLCESLMVAALLAFGCTPAKDKGDDQASQGGEEVVVAGKPSSDDPAEDNALPEQPQMAEEESPVSATVVDASGQILGTLLSAQSLQVRVAGTHRIVKLESFTAGFSEQTEFDQCIFLREGCTGDCILKQFTSVGRASASSIYRPKGVIDVVAWQSQHGLSGECEQQSGGYSVGPSGAVPGNSGNYETSAQYYKSRLVSFTLPFHILETP